MIAFELDPNRNLRRARFAGCVDDQELLAEYRRLVRDPSYDATADELLDLRRVERFEVSADGLRRLSDLHSMVDRRGSRPRFAIVADAPLTYGMWRMYELLRGDGAAEEIRVFRDHGAAEDWLRTGRTCAPAGSPLPQRGLAAAGRAR